MREQIFRFEFEVSNEFRRESPTVAQEFIDLHKRRISATTWAVGPRGGTYRLVSTPDYWREDDLTRFGHAVTVFLTKRLGRYVRPDRVPVPSESMTFSTLTIPVVEGRATLPSGEVVETPSQFIVVPVLSA